MHTIEYWRQNKLWSALLGKRATVVAVTQVLVSQAEQEVLTPYSYVLVDDGKEKREMMGVAGEILEVGDTVEFVLRKLGQEKAAEIIPYGLKAQKVCPEGEKK